jgi:phenylpyruvate tautomerase PptA (4-oxalocrotonate tautomerase family)
MPRIRVEWLNTRTAGQRRDIAKRITDAFVDIVAVRPDQVTVVFEEIDPRLQAKGGVFWDEILKKR